MAKYNNNHIKFNRMAFSCKYLKTGLTDLEYYIAYENLFWIWESHFNCFIDYIFEELDTHGILHVHGVIKIPKNYKYTGLITKGYNVNIKRLSDPLKWVKYCSKNGTNRVYRDYEELSPCAEYTPKLNKRIIPLTEDRPLICQEFTPAY